MANTDVIGVLLAGGQSRRMGGGDKGMLELGGAPLMQRVMERLRPQVSAMVINANGDPARFACFGLPVVADATADFAGPLSGVLAGLDWARANHSGVRFVVTAACDTPFFPQNLVAELVRATYWRYPAIALAASDEGAHPVFGLWPTALADDLRAALAGGVRKVLDWTDKHGARLAKFPPAELPGGCADPFFNINTPDELVKAERLLARP
jgi:molybdopterin-guanine dinucleotide biosynthesis protein A